MKTKLTLSSTIFKDETHQYFNEKGKELSGITSALKRQIFPDKYKDVPQHILDAAAQYGTAVHQDIQAWENDNDQPIFTEEGTAYQDIRPEGLQFIADEYLVSNETTHASQIDLVFTEDNKSVILADIKCNANLDEEYLTWQLSCYAYLFEKQNPKIKVKKLLGIWIPNRTKYPDKQPKFIELKRIANKKIEEMLDNDANGLLPDVAEQPNLPAEVQNLLTGVQTLLTKEKRIADEKKALQEALLTACEAHGIKKWDNEVFSLTYVAPTTRTSIDSTALKKAHPEIAEEFTKVSNVSASIRLKLKCS